MEDEDTFGDLLPSRELVLLGDDAVPFHTQVLTGDTIGFLLPGDHDLGVVVSVDRRRALLQEFVGKTLVVTVHDVVGDVTEGGVEGAVDGSLSDGNPQVPLIVLSVDGGSEYV